MRPWADFLALLEPYYLKRGQGRPPIPQPVRLRIYFLPQGFGGPTPPQRSFLLTWSRRAAWPAWTRVTCRMRLRYAIPASLAEA